MKKMTITYLAIAVALCAIWFFAAYVPYHKEHEKTRADIVEAEKQLTDFQRHLSRLEKAPEWLVKLTIEGPTGMASCVGKVAVVMAFLPSAYGPFGCGFWPKFVVHQVSHSAGAALRLIRPTLFASVRSRLVLWLARNRCLRRAAPILVVWSRRGASVRRNTMG